MINRLALIILLFISNKLINAQEQSALLDSLRFKFESFEYSEAINTADIILSNRNNLPKTDLTEVYLIKGTSYFSLWNKSAAKECFENILTIDSLFTPDPAKISPKVIAFFDEVKLNFSNEMKTRDTTAIINSNASKSFYEENLLLKEKLLSREAVIKSIIFPGWGRQSKDYELKGWFLTVSGLIPIGTSAYFILDSNKKEKAYLTETNANLIQSKYNTFNNSYKLRNISISFLAAIWIYNIVDILFISQ